MFDMIAKGGVILWVIMGLSVVGIAIIIERLMYLKKIQVDEDQLFNRVKGALQKSHYDEALAICDTSISPLAKLIKVGIEYRDHPQVMQKEVLKDTANQETPELEKHISSLGTIAHIAPLLGLLGTVTGTMKAFGVLGTFGAVSDPSVLAKGVSEALITTVGGIIVAVPAVIFYNYLVTRVNTILIRMENQVNALIAILSPQGRKEGQK